MCGSRTGGWSLPGVMSDWQHCVDWLLAKYCRCRLRLDWCWCRWRTSAKCRHRWGLSVWRRQVGLIEGPDCQWSQVRAAWWKELRDEVVNGFLVESKNQGRAGTTWEPSHEWRLAEATPSSRGLQWFTRKLLGYSVDPQNRGRRLDQEVWPPRPVQPPRRGGQTAWAGQIARAGLTAPGGVWLPWTLAPRCFEAEDMHRDHKACIEAKQVAVAGHPSDEENLKTSYSPLRVLYP
jgi:hypothetical protein